MEHGTDSHYVSFLSERSFSDDERREHPRPKIHGNVTQSLREAILATGNNGNFRSRMSQIFVNSSRRVRRQRFLLWSKLWRNPRLRLQRIFAILLIVCICFVCSLWVMNSYISQDDIIVSFVESNHKNEQESDVRRFPFQAHRWEEQHYQNAFKTFQQEHNRQYKSDEESAYRYSVFKQNQAYINSHNEQGYSFTLKMNKFGDLAREEFREKYLGKIKGTKTLTEVAEELNNPQLHKNLPGTFSWIEKGCVAPVKDQKNCGSCWAFSATGAVEGAVCANGGKLRTLSEQQLVDCAGPEGNAGCHGGDMKQAFQYVLDANGLCSEETYPYEAADLTCRSSSCTPIAKIGGYKAVPPDSECALKAAITKYGPVSVSIQADQMPFQFYHDGVFDAACGEDLDHGVLTVGYGTDEHAKKDFWMVKNSWGEGWGDKGYIKMAMHAGTHGQCGILMDSSFPTIDASYKSFK